MKTNTLVLLFCAVLAGCADEKLTDAGQIATTETPAAAAADPELQAQFDAAEKYYQEHCKAATTPEKKKALRAEIGARYKYIAGGPCHAVPAATAGQGEVTLNTPGQRVELANLPDDHDPKTIALVNASEKFYQEHCGKATTPQELEALRAETAARYRFAVYGPCKSAAKQ